MKLVTFDVAGRSSFGILTDRGIVDLASRLTAYAALHDLVAAGAVEAARPFADAEPDHAHAEVRLDKPLLDFGKCFCVGVNYPERNAEYRDGSDVPKYPSLFVRFPESFVGPEQALVRPPESAQLDYEGEVALVVGKAGRRIPAERWAEHVMGYTIANEGTIRDWVRHGKFNVTPGKNWDRTGSLGPWLVTADEVGEGPMTLVTRVNGEERQRDTTDRLMFPFGRIVSYVSTFCTLKPGDIILTGTPSGAGARLDPPRFLAPGDLVEVEVSGLGTLRNGVADESPAAVEEDRP